MLFYDYAFLYAFLPATLLVYYALPIRARNGWLFLSSCLFYATSSLNFLPLLLISIGIDYFAGKRLAEAIDTAQRKAWLLVSVCVNLGMLAVFKYGGFLALNLRAFTSSESIPLIELALPVGISFYTFQSMSYTIDLYRKRVEPVRSLIDFAAYVTMFPQLIAGPIVRFSDMQQQLQERRHDLDHFSSGLFIFVVGLGKKLLVADTLAALSGPLFTQVQPGFLDAWIGMFLFAGQIYFDFSGYSDMAVGLGRLFGFELPKNFDAPYRAISFSDFWRRWHITLSAWLRDYLYIPLGGNRRGSARTMVNLAMTMLLGGLWHGASWNFVLWGGLHGALLCAERLLRSIFPAPPLVVRRALVFLAVVVVWTPFRLETLPQTFSWWSAMAGLSGVGAAGTLQSAGVVVFLALVWMPPFLLPEKPRFRMREVVTICALFFVALAVGYGRLTPSPFLYFRF